MKIDYKTEVNSGYDRKVIVEGVISDLLKRGISPEILIKQEGFNFRHIEMLRNLTKNYEAKLEFLDEQGIIIPDIPGEVLSDSYSKVVHGIRELYPMTEEEQQDIFLKRDLLNYEIEKSREKDYIQVKEKSNNTLQQIEEIREKYPIINNMENMILEIDKLLLEKELNPQDIDLLFDKYNINKENYISYKEIYDRYQKLINDLKEESQTLSENSSVKNDSLETKKLIRKRNEVEDEIVSKNIKLVNFFIRSEYGFLLAEQEELYGICLEGLAYAVKNFDLAKQYKFSPLAFKAMDLQVKKHFKELTGETFEDYWNKRKIGYLISSLSGVLGKQATIDDLSELGLIDLSNEQMLKYKRKSIALLDLYAYPLKNPQTFEDYDKLDEYENEIYKNENFSDEDILENVFQGQVQEKLEEALYKLNNRERIALVMNFGLDRNIYMDESEREFFGLENNMQVMSLKEIGEKLGITIERTRMIINKALGKFRMPRRYEDIKNFYKER